MKASRFTDAHKALIVKQGNEGTTVAKIRRKAGISQATYFNWENKYEGLMPSEMRRLRGLEDENNRPKWIVADLTLDREMVSQWSEMDLSRFRSAPRAHLSGLSFESQWTFSA